MVENNHTRSFIDLEEINKVFLVADKKFVALSDITVSFHKNEFTSVVGRSGSGKSTLMNMITGIDKPTSGKIMIDNMEISHFSETEMAKWRGKNLGIVFQFYQLIPVLSLLENVMLPMQIAGLYTPSERLERANNLLDQVNLQKFVHQKPFMVSGGQQQSTAIARALANDPSILIADEPTGNLSSKEADQVFEIFQNLSSGGKTIIMVTHDEDLAKRAQRVLKLVDGKLSSEKISSPSFFSRLWRWKR
jgi:putative ABC transport system ATP-binding protein